MKDGSYNSWVLELTMYGQGLRQYVQARETEWGLETDQLLRFIHDDPYDELMDSIADLPEESPKGGIPFY